MTIKLNDKSVLLTMLLLSFASAHAAGLETFTITPLHSWAGYHLGVDLGVQTRTANQALTVNDPQQSLSGQGANADQAALLTGNAKTVKNIAIGGIHADYLLQENGLVYGVAAELMASNCNRSASANSLLNDPTKAPFPDYSSTVSSKNCLSYLSAIKGKAGYAVGNVLLYVDGGLAFGRVRSSTVATIANTGNPPSDVWSGSSAKTMTGYMIGAGIQVALEKNISLGLGLSHYDLGKTSYATKPDTFTAGDQPGVDQSIASRAKGNLAKISLSYQY
ncbi:outer membrane protein [Actimicrobium sp. CCI2.3]|uniref:outer membrane protein n=1 Tax=Actimicrobium sp. CCI2.3 TaxID=3048616 RepID=UPI002AB35E42|nr:outer membrane beta-barrel protein [Actimicrobium sp. CCI2.3]MDY7574605.1 outer membrane beta-barrel protein [Actimicrobium sp. CCI2.3]MEB0023896.1 outer membrane beta-barrel protein [Actimicrobium sp. CCI2.3]